MTLTSEQRTRFTAELEAAKQEQRRCMGGVDSIGCVKASQDISRLRNLLRDDERLFAHLRVIAATPHVRRSKRRAA